MSAAPEHAKVEEMPAQDLSTGRPTHPWAGAAPTRVDAAVASLIAAAVMVLAVFWRTMLVPTDPWRYVRSAIDFPTDGWVPLGYTRYGLILAEGVPLLMFGNAQATYYFWPVISSGLLAAVLYLIGRRWWGPVAGALAVVLFLANTVVLLNLSRGYPDIMSVAITMWALYLALLARDRLAQGRLPVLLLLMVGALLGWGFEVRETSMFLWPVVVAVLWHRAQLWRAAGVVLLPLLAWAALDIGISWWAYGDPLLKVGTLTGNVVEASTTASGEPAADNIVGRPRSYYFLVTPLAALRSPDGIWMIALVTVAALGVLVRNWPVRLLSGSLVLMFLLNVLPAGGLDPSKPRGKLDVARYWIQYFPSAALVVAGMVVLGVGWLARRRGLGRGAGTGLAVVVAVVVAAYPVATGVRYLATFPAFAPNGGSSMEALRDHLRGQLNPEQEIWTDWNTQRLLRPYERDAFGGDKVWEATSRSLTGPGEPDAGDLVLLNSARSSTCGHCRTALGPWLEENPTVPSTWVKVYESETGNLELYRVER